LLKEHATQGFIDMKPMGGRYVLSEEAVAAAVDYMLGHIKPTAATGVNQDLTKGRAIYVAHCGACHDAGEHGAPILGNDAAWAERTPFWEAVLAGHVEDGFLAMPARASDPQLSNEDIAVAVEYMISWESIP
jgi:cytochrome c5